jgi:hypothetical protein
VHVGDRRGVPRFGLPDVDRQRLHDLLTINAGSTPWQAATSTIPKSAKRFSDYGHAPAATAGMVIGPKGSITPSVRLK